MSPIVRYLWQKITKKTWTNEFKGYDCKNLFLLVVSYRKIVQDFIKILTILTSLTFKSEKNSRISGFQPFLREYFFVIQKEFKRLLKIIHQRFEPTFSLNRTIQTKKTKIYLLDTSEFNEKFIFFPHSKEKL